MSNLQYKNNNVIFFFKCPIYNIKITIFFIFFLLEKKKKYLEKYINFDLYIN